MYSYINTLLFQSRSVMNQYDAAFLRFTVFFTFFLCLPIAVLFFVLALNYNVVDYDIWIGPIILVSFPLLAFLYCLLRILNEKRLVKLQRDRYGIRITDEPARQIERKSSVPKPLQSA